MRRFVFTILFCLSVYGIAAFLAWDITLGCLDKSWITRLAFLCILIGNSFIYCPLNKDK